MKHRIPTNTPLWSASIMAILCATSLLGDTVPDGTCDAPLMQGSMTQISATHATVTTSILIDAPAATVWATLTDFDAMPDWSTNTLQGITGDIQNGGDVVITFLFGVDENGAPNIMTIPHTLIYEDGVKLGWSDPFPTDIGGGRDNHIYHVAACGNQTRFTQSDEISDNPYATNFAQNLLPLYQTFNTDLKTAVEN